MKKVFSFLLSIFLIILFTSCVKVNNTPDLDIAPELVINEDLVGLISLEIQYLDNLIMILITNHSEKEISVYTSPLIEYYADSEWRSLLKTEYYGFEEESIPLIPNESRLLYSGLSAFIHPTSGRFRYRNYVYLCDDDSIKLDHSRHDIVIEFLLD